MNSEIMRTQTRLTDGLLVRYADTGPHDGPVILLTSPWPESLLAFRRIWPALIPNGRVVALDLPGFGHSAGRADLFTPQAMGEFLARFIRDGDLGAPHLVTPDVGSGAGLFLAARHPELVSSMVTGGGAVAVPLDVAGTLADIIAAPGPEAFTDMDIRATIGATVEPVASQHGEPEVWEDYVSAYEGGRFAESTRYVRSYPEQLPLLRDLLPGIRVPVQVVSAVNDPLVPPSNGRYLAGRIPGARLSLLEAGHFAWEEVPDQYAALVNDWVTRSGRYVPSPSERVRDQVARYEASGGADGGELGGLPVVILTTTGAKSGSVRKNPVMRVERDGVYAAIASYAGNPRNPQWYYNLLAQPQARLQDGPVVRRVRAREVSGAEKERWWTVADALNPNYARYRASAGRDIPILVLEPAG